jgi:hypothetical protein
VTFFSTSSDPDSTITGLTWDLDNDGQFDDATGSVAKHTFAAVGSYTVSLRAVDADGADSVYTQTVVVGTPAPRPTTTVTPADAGPQLLSPFPIVRISGRVTRKGTRLRLFSVDSPYGVLVTVRCRGGSCPFRYSARSTLAPAKPQAKATRLVRIRKIERRLLRPGVVLRVFVTKDGKVGKYTALKIRKRRPPTRTDACVMPGSMKPVRCPG